MGVNRLLRRVKSYILFISTLVLLFLGVQNLAFAQQSPPPAPKDTSHFRMPEGVPEIYNPPDKTGKLKHPIITYRKQSQLMNPGETYPPLQVKIFLGFLFVAAVFSFYWIFLRGKVKLSSIARYFSFLEGLFSGQRVTSPVKRHSTQVSKVSPHEVIEDMVIALEEEKKDEESSFVSFSRKNAYLSLPPIDFLQVDPWHHGVNLIFTNSSFIKRILILNLIYLISRRDYPLILSLGTLSHVDIVDGIIALESDKRWEDMDEAEKYRISLLVEEYIERYRHLYMVPKLHLYPSLVTSATLKIRKKGKPVGFILEDLQIQKGSDINEIVNTLNLISKKCGLPIFVFEEGSVWDDLEFSKIQKVLKVTYDNEEKMAVVEDVKNSKEPPIKLKFVEKTGRVKLS